MGHFADFTKFHMGELSQLEAMGTLPNWLKQKRDLINPSFGVVLAAANFSECVAQVLRLTLTA